MKRLFVLGILLFAGTLCLATPAFVQGKFGGNPTSALAFTSNNTAGNTIIVMLECSNGGSVCMTNLTDSQGNTYRKFAVVNSSSSWFLYIYVATNIASGANTVTCNSFGGFQRMAIAEYSGTGTTYPIRSVSFGFAGSGATLSGNISGAMTTVSGDLVVAWGFSLGGSMSAGTGCTARATNDGFGMFEDCTVSGSSLSPTMTNGSNAWSFVAVDLCPSDCFPASVNTVRWNAASSTSTTSQTITLPANTANNLMVLGIRLSAVLSISVSDSAGNTWKKAYCNNATSQETCLFYAEGIASSGSTNTVTITWGGSTRNVQAFLKEYSNVGSSGVLRYAGCGYSCTGDSNSTPKKGSVPSASSDLIVKLTNTSGNMVYAPPSGYNFITGNDAQFNAMMYLW
jgi:hypothetical protein